VAAGIDTYTDLAEIRENCGQRTLRCSPLLVRRYSQSLLHDRSAFQGEHQALCIDSAELEMEKKMYSVDTEGVLSIGL